MFAGGHFRIYPCRQAIYFVFFATSLAVPAAAEPNVFTVVSARASTMTNNYEVKDGIFTDLDKNSLCLW